MTSCRESLKHSALLALLAVGSPSCVGPVQDAARPSSFDSIDRVTPANSTYWGVLTQATSTQFFQLRPDPITPAADSIWAAGSVEVSGSRHGRIWTLAPTSGTLTPLLTVQVGAGETSEFVDLLHPSPTSAHAIGTGLVSGVKQAFFRGTADTGATWPVTASVIPGGSLDAESRALNRDGSGNLYWALAIEDASSVRWTLKKSTDLGGTWNTKDDFVLTAAADSSPRALAIGPSQQLLVVGSGTTGGIEAGLIRISTDGGDTWNSSTFQLEGGAPTRWNAIVAHATDGTFSVCGTATASGRSRALIRTTADTGTTWSTVLEDSPNPSAASDCRALTLDPDGNLIWTGTIVHPDGGTVGIVRRLAAGQTSTLDTFRLSTQAATLMATSFQATLKLSWGDAINEFGVPSGVVRKLLSP